MNNIYNSLNWTAAALTLGDHLFDRSFVYKPDDGHVLPGIPFDMFEYQNAVVRAIMTFSSTLHYGLYENSHIVTEGLDTFPIRPSNEFSTWHPLSAFRVLGLWDENIGSGTGLAMVICRLHLQCPAQTYIPLKVDQMSTIVYYESPVVRQLTWVNIFETSSCHSWASFTSTRC